MSSKKQIRDKREPVGEHPLSPDSLRIEEDEFSDLNDNPMVRLLSALHRPLSRPTAATGAIPKDKNYNHQNRAGSSTTNQPEASSSTAYPGFSARRQFHSRPFPLPVETTETSFVDEGESSHKVLPTKMEDIPKCGPDFENLLRKLKPRIDSLVNQLPVDDNAAKSKLDAAPKEQKSESSEDSEKRAIKKSALKLAHEASQMPCAQLEPGRRQFDFDSQPGHRPVNQLGGPYNRVPFEEAHYSPRRRLLPEISNTLKQLPDIAYPRNLQLPFALDLPDLSQMNITMNPDFVDDGADFVDVNVGQKSSAEHRRLSNLIAESGNRSSSMPPLSMPARVMVLGNIAVGGPAYLGVQRQHAFEVDETMARPRRTPSTTESASRTENSDALFSSDSGFNVFSDQTSSNLLSGHSSSTSALLPLDTVPLRMETPTGIDDLPHDDAMSQSDGPQESKSSSDPYFGKCFKCDEGIVGEFAAVKAMGKVFHKRCFICTECGLEMDNKPFYFVKGKVFCEKDYVERGFKETAEICDVCGCPIMDIIITSLNKNYHTKCFCCCVCSKNLEGREFTIDKGKIFCIGDYFAKFAPKCTICHRGIYPLDNNRYEKVRVVSREMDYHIDCYKCEFCGLGLADEETAKCFPLNEHLFCFNCHRVHQASMHMIDESQVTEPQAVECYFT